MTPHQDSGAAGQEPGMGTGRAAGLGGSADPGMRAEISNEVFALSQRGVRAGQVYEGEYFGIQYHVLATFEGYAWILMVASEREPRKPRTEPFSFLERLSLKHELEASHV
jgi:hypothetical protein